MWGNVNVINSVPKQSSHVRVQNSMLGQNANNVGNKSSQIDVAFGHSVKIVCLNVSVIKSEWKAPYLKELNDRYDMVCFCEQYVVIQTENQSIATIEPFKCIMLIWGIIVYVRECVFENVKALHSWYENV